MPATIRARIGQFPRVRGRAVRMRYTTCPMPDTILTLTYTRDSPIIEPRREFATGE